MELTAEGIRKAGEVYSACTQAPALVVGSLRAPGLVACA